jgi:uncharacterized protein YecA (UPF0149 family)
VKKIEATQKLGFTLVSTTLLSFDRKVQQQVIDWLNIQCSQVNKDPNDHNFTMVFNDFGLTFYINKEKKLHLSQILDDYANSKMHETKSNQWICIILEPNNDGDYNISFLINNKTDQMEITSEKIGRNDPCPCGSGEKYKKCCGRKEINQKK